MSMDLEGIPTDRSYYLIGLLVTHHNGTHQKSFWADDEDDEAQIFMEMLDYIRPYRDYTVLHYGAYNSCPQADTGKASCRLYGTNRTLTQAYGKCVIYYRATHIFPRFYK